jgi:hypothetical protein
MMAAGYGDARLVEGLLNAGADASKQTPSGISTLEEAVSGAFDINEITLGN